MGDVYQKVEISLQVTVQLLKTACFLHIWRVKKKPLGNPKSEIYMQLRIDFPETSL